MMTKKQAKRDWCPFYVRVRPSIPSSDDLEKGLEEAETRRLERQMHEESERVLRDLNSSPQEIETVQ